MDLFQRPNTLRQTELAFNLQCSSWTWLNIRDIFRTTIHFKTLLHASAWLGYERVWAGRHRILGKASVIDVNSPAVPGKVKPSTSQHKTVLFSKDRQINTFPKYFMQQDSNHCPWIRPLCYPIFESNTPWWMQSTHLQCFREVSVVIGISTDSASQFFNICSGLQVLKNY